MFMRSTKKKIVPFRPFIGVSKVSRIGNGYDVRAGSAVQDPILGRGCKSEDVYRFRRLVVEAYFDRKEKYGGDPVSSVAVVCCCDRNSVERILEAEIGRMPSWISLHYLRQGHGTFIGRWEDLQKKMDEKYGRNK